MNRRGCVQLLAEISTLTLIAVALTANAALAADAHTSDKAKPGEIVLLRKVDMRPATRMAPPGIALIVDPSPKREIGAVLSSNDEGMVELADADIASVTSNSNIFGSTSDAQMQNNTQGKLNNALGVTTRDGNLLANGQLSHALNSNFGAIGGVARSTGGMVKNSLGQMPLFGGTGP